MIRALSFTVSELVPSREVVEHDGFIDAIEETPRDDPSLVERPVGGLRLPQSGALTAPRPRAAP
jgi:hypothetical protein